jgi:hypothetical protein
VIPTFQLDAARKQEKGREHSQQSENATSVYISGYQILAALALWLMGLVNGSKFC